LEAINDGSMNTKVLTAHVPLPLAKKVDQIGARLERSRGWIIKQALSAWIEQEEERRRLTLEALADVDAGRVIDHQAVQAWADSLDSDKPLPTRADGVEVDEQGSVRSGTAS
jgi:predicted transcriptional regulator